MATCRNSREALIRKQSSSDVAEERGKRAHVGYAGVAQAFALPHVLMHSLICTRIFFLPIGYM